MTPLYATPSSLVSGCDSRRPRHWPGRWRSSRNSVIEDMPRTSAGIRFTTKHHRFASADGVFQEALTAQYARMFDRGAAFFGAFADEMSGTQGCSRS